MTRLKAHFDGKVFVPDEPVNLPPDTSGVLQWEAIQHDKDCEHGTAAYLAKHLTPLPDEDAEEMRRAIAEADIVHPIPDVELD